MHIRILLFTLFINTLTPLKVFAQYKTEVLAQNIKTLMVQKEGQQLSDPVIHLQGKERIVVSFDDLNEDEPQYNYSLIHCNANWEKSNLSRTEYLRGFSEGYFDDYDYSFNTNINYVHYRVAVPNDDMQFTKSGNYVLVVKESNNPDKVVCTACFYVVDQQVKIQPFIDFNTMVDIKKTTQQINFNVQIPNYNISDPHIETKVVVQQNNSTLNEVRNIQPTYTRPKMLIYEENPKLIFKGGNEYRNFDGVSTRFFGEGVYNIEYFTPYYHVTLNKDEKREHTPYFFKHDINGRFVIRRQEADQDQLDLESDYYFVHFTIPMEDPMLTGEIFFNGAFTHNRIDETTKMVYNFDSKAYEGTYFLKQGYYNYRYLFRPSNKTVLLNIPMENDYYETENDYSIYFYHRPMSGRYDRLVGYVKFNSLKRL